MFHRLDYLQRGDAELDPNVVSQMNFSKLRVPSFRVLLLLIWNINVMELLIYEIPLQGGVA